MRLFLPYFGCLASSEPLFSSSPKPFMMDSRQRTLQGTRKAQQEPLPDFVYGHLSLATISYSRFGCMQIPCTAILLNGFTCLAYYHLRHLLG